jgi:hypothetical protein
VTDSGDLSNEANRTRASWLNKFNLVLLLVYIALLVGGLFGLYQLSNWASHTYDTSQAQESWSKWQDETERQSKGGGPVERRKAKSDEPPALVLARDYFVTLTVIFVLLGTILFATIALMFRGVLSSPGRVMEDATQN